MLLRNAMRRPRAVEYGSLSWEDLNRQFRKIFLSGGPYDTGIRGAERLSPVAAAHRILCNDFGMIPFSLYRKNGDAREPVQDPDLDLVFKLRPSVDRTPYMLGRTVMSNAFWHGFGAVWNRRGPDGRILERIPLPSDCCSIRQDQTTGQYYYDYSARETIGAEGAAQQYGRKFYQNGAMISGIVEVDTDLGKEERDRVRNEFAKYNPYGDDAFKVAVLGRGYKYTPIGLNQKDSQYIESRTFSVEEVARFSGVPKSMLQSGKESFESNQQQRIVFVTDVLMPYIVQWEQENSYKCLFRQQRADGLYFKGNPAVLLRGDDKSRAEFLTTMIQNGMLNPDEARALEERAPIPGGWGQTFFITKNLGSMESVAKGEPTNG